MLFLLFNPATEDEERIAFTVSEANIDDAIAYGHAERTKSLSKQIDATAYHMVLQLDVCTDVERICDEPWVIVRDGRIVGRNLLAAHIQNDDLVQ